MDEPVQHPAALMKGDFSAKNVIGFATLTPERFVFTRQKYNPGAGAAVGGPLAGALAARLQKKHEESEGPVFDVAVADIRRLARAKHRLSRNVLVLEFADGRSLRFTDGFKHFGEPLKRVLTEYHGRTLVEDGPDAWRAEPAGN